MLNIKVKTRDVHVDEADLAKVREIQDAALRIAQEHLIGPFREIESKKYEGQDIACALIMMAYYMIRQSKPAGEAMSAFDILTHFAIEKHEFLNHLRSDKSVN